MNRFFFLIIWCLAGFCIYLGGCSARISAEKLEASYEIRDRNQQAPTTVEVYYDKADDKSGVDKVESETP